MNVLQELLGNFEINDFVRSHLFQEPFAAPQTARKFENLVSWPMLTSILACHEDCWLPFHGRLPEDPCLRQGTLKLHQAHTGFLQGRTLLIRHAERADVRLAQIAADFADLFCCPIDIQLYATPSGEEGFDWHYDIEDVFVIQSAGEKEFRLLRNTVTLRPLPLMTKENCRFSAEMKSPEIRCWLKAGDWLYIPAGYWHKAQALTDSFHLSVKALRQSARRP